MRHLALVAALAMAACGSDSISQFRPDVDPLPDSARPDTGCTPETNSQFCVRFTTPCGELVQFDNCGVERNIVCGVCPDASVGTDADPVDPPDADPVDPPDAASSGLDASSPDVGVPPGPDASSPGLDASTTPGPDAARPGPDASSVVPPDASIPDPCLLMDCNDNSPCTTDFCSNATCQHNPLTGSCWLGGGIYGVCSNGSCCTGCLQSGSCRPGNTPDACGHFGGSCSSCDDNNPCTDDACPNYVSTITCQHPPKMNGTACPSGVCISGSCLPCGSPTQHCCSGGVCNSGATCGGTPPTDQCTACGGKNQICCPGRICDAADPSLMCYVDSFCRCGMNYGDPCCLDKTCAYGRTCSQMSQTEWNCY